VSWQQDARITRCDWVVIWPRAVNLAATQQLMIRRAATDRRFVTNESKAKTVTRHQLDKVRDEHVRMSLELQQAFGLRREEAMKFQPSFADRGDHLVLKASWTKGGRERTIPSGPRRSGMCSIAPGGSPASAP
jgi:Integrase